MLGGELAARYGLRAPFFAGAAIVAAGVLAVGHTITSEAIDDARVAGEAA